MKQFFLIFLLLAMTLFLSACGLSVNLSSSGDSAFDGTYQLTQESIQEKLGSAEGVTVMMTLNNGVMTVTETKAYPYQVRENRVVASGYPLPILIDGNTLTIADMTFTQQTGEGIEGAYQLTDGIVSYGTSVSLALQDGVLYLSNTMNALPYTINSGRLHMARPETDPDSSYLCLDFHPRLLSSFSGSIFEEKYVVKL